MLRLLVYLYKGVSTGYEAYKSERIPDLDLYFESGQWGYERITKENKREWKKGSTWIEKVHHSDLPRKLYRNRPSDYETGDFKIEGFVKDLEIASKLDFISRGPFLLRLATDEIQIYNPSRDYTKPELVISECEEITDWTISNGVLVADTDRIDGDYSVRGSFPSPGTVEYLAFDPPGQWDLSTYRVLRIWVKSSKDSASYTSSRLYLVQDATNVMYWDLTLVKGWEFYRLDLSKPDATEGSPSLSTIDYLKIQVEPSASPFTLWADRISCESPDTRAREWPVYSVDSLQLARSVVGRGIGWRYVLALKQVPPV